MREIFEHIASGWRNKVDFHYKDTFKDPNFLVLGWYDGPIDVLALWKGKLYELRDASSRSVRLTGSEWIARPLDGMSLEEIDKAMSEPWDVFAPKATLRFLCQGDDEQWSTVPFNFEDEKHFWG